ncbi:preprotein translocase subunit YajC [Spirochaetota bacterium]|nr:preprotein translocase subunit YajC [Spirochaetota bacterium]
MIDILYAQANNSGGSSPFGVFLPFVLVILIFYFLLIRPQAKKQKALERKRENLRKGDIFITSGGLYAKVNHFKNDGKIVVAELAKDVRVEVVRATIMEVLGVGAEAETTSKSDAQSKSAKTTQQKSNGSNNKGRK